MHRTFRSTAAALVPSCLMLALGCGGNGPTGPGSGSGSAPNISGVWTFNETITGTGLTCQDRGTFTFSQTAATFTGTVAQIGECQQSDGSGGPNVGPLTIVNGSVSATAMTFTEAGTSSCTYTTTALTGSPPTAASGTISCSGAGGTATGTWQATKGQSTPAAFGTAAVVYAGAGGANCLVTGIQTAYCWGNNLAGILGTGDIAPREAPTTVTGKLNFASLALGLDHTCGLTPSGQAYCWGRNSFGQLGTGGGTGGSPADSPVAVTGSLTFASLAAGDIHTCGIATSKSTYCWGDGSLGQLGTGNTNGATAPTAVTGSTQFTGLAAGGSTTCGLTAAGAAYCWGDGFLGQLGNGSSGSGVMSATPVAVSGGLTFGTVSVSQQYVCGVTPAGAAYCWGGGQSATPTAVTGGLSFASISTGGVSGPSTCGVTTTGAAYCWGDNSQGELGIGGLTPPSTSAPAAVKGGLVFASVSVGDLEACGLTTGKVPYCWGFGANGSLGTGDFTNANSTVPVKVAGQP